MAAIGISAYGVYIPRYRLSRKTISGAMGWLSPGTLPGEKAVTNYDEDSLTMAVAAGINCLRGADRAVVDSLYFASPTFPYRERESAANGQTGGSSWVRTSRTDCGILSGKARA